MKRTENIARNSEISEKRIEKYLCDRVKKLGGLSLKFSDMNATGYPDRIVMLPGGITIWFELKSFGKRASKIQHLRFKEMWNLAQTVFLCDSKKQIDDVLDFYSK